MFLKIKNLSQSKFIRSVIILATGTAGAQALTMVFSPIITRMYGPEAFGLLGTFTATLGIVTPIAALAYPIAIVLPKSDDDAKGIARLSFRIALFMALSLSVILLFSGDQIAALLGMQAIAGFMLFIPLTMFFSALQQIMQQWLIRKKQFKVTARIGVSQSLILNSSKVGIGWFWPIGSVLIILATLASAVYAIQLWFGAKKWADEDGRIDKSSESKVDLKALAYRYRDFPYYRAPQVFINAISHSLPILMLASFFGPASAGFYTLGRTVLGLPSMLIGKAVSDVFYPTITEAANRNENLYRPIFKATLVLAGVGIVPYGVFFIFGPSLFSFVFGEEWIVAGEYARWLSAWSYFGFINRPSVAAIAVLNMQGFFLVYEIVSLMLRAVSLYIGFAVLNNDVQAVILFSISGVILNLALIFLTLLKGKAK